MASNNEEDVVVGLALPMNSYHLQAPTFCGEEDVEKPFAESIDVAAICINNILGETDLLLAQKKRLDHALLATEVLMHIATDNLNCRQRRQGIDLVQDECQQHFRGIKIPVWAHCSRCTCRTTST